MSEEDIKQIIAQLNRLEGKVVTGFHSLKETDSFFRQDIKQLAARLDIITQDRPCNTCTPMKQLAEVTISRWQIRGIWSALGIIFSKILWEWWGQK